MLSILILGLISCRDTKQNEADTEAAVEQIETIEAEAEAVSEEIDKEAKALEDDLKELDKI